MISHKQLANWYTQLGQHLEAGVLLADALRMCEDPPTKDREFIADRIQNGDTFEAVLRDAPKWLPQADRYFLAAAMETGNLPRTFKNLADLSYALGTFIAAGVPAPSAWRLSTKMVNDERFHQVLKKLEPVFASGHEPGDALKAYKCFPPVAPALAHGTAPFRRGPDLPESPEQGGISRTIVCHRLDGDGPFASEDTTVTRRVKASMLRSLSYAGHGRPRGFIPYHVSRISYPGSQIPHHISRISNHLSRVRTRIQRTSSQPVGRLG